MSLYPQHQSKRTYVEVKRLQSRRTYARNIRPHHTLLTRILTCVQAFRQDLSASRRRDCTLLVTSLDLREGEFDAFVQNLRNSDLTPCL
jgi:hypothetical protein